LREIGGLVEVPNEFQNLAVKKFIYLIVILIIFIKRLGIFHVQPTVFVKEAILALQNAGNRWILS
jgi:hypothetical protein